ncbi:ORF6N domain-containing protein [Escherichia coli]|nr:ORF6N domain-containing protein [Escherichia coli]
MATQISVESLSPITHNQLPVITTELLAQLYGTKIKNISDNFLNNTTRFVVGKHYFKIEKNELREFKNRPETIGLVGKNARSLILWTERGAARHAKMLETDQAWEVFEKLEDCYFSHRQIATELDRVIRGDGRTLVIRFDEHGNIIFTETVSNDALVCTLERFKFYLEQHGWLVVHKKQLVERLMQL